MRPQTWTSMHKKDKIIFPKIVPGDFNFQEVSRDYVKKILNVKKFSTGLFKLQF